MNYARWIGLAVVGLMAGAVAWKASPLPDALGAVERLQLVWPKVATMDPAEREFLSQVASACDLPHVPVDKEAVVACLRKGAASGTVKPQPMFKDAPVALESLLTRAGDGSAK